MRHSRFRSFPGWRVRLSTPESCPDSSLLNHSSLIPMVCVVLSDAKVRQSFRFAQKYNPAVGLISENRPHRVGKRPFHRVFLLFLLPQSVHGLRASGGRCGGGFGNKERIMAACLSRDAARVGVWEACLSGGCVGVCLGLSAGSRAVACLGQDAMQPVLHRNTGCSGTRHGLSWRAIRAALQSPFSAKASHEQVLAAVHP